MQLALSARVTTLAAALTALTLGSCDSPGGTWTAFTIDGSRTILSQSVSGGSHVLEVLEGDRLTRSAGSGDLCPTLDLDGLAWLDEGATLALSEWNGEAAGAPEGRRGTPDREARFIGDADRTPLLTYREAGGETEPDDADAAWLSSRLSELWRETDLGAEAHARAVEEARGLDGLLDLAGTVKSQRRAWHFLQLAVDSEQLTAAGARAVVEATTGSTVYETDRLGLLLAAAHRAPEDEELTALLASAAGGFGHSDHRADLIRDTGARGFDEATGAVLLDAAAGIPYERSRVAALTALAPLGPAEALASGRWTRDYLAATRGISGSSERGQALVALALVPGHPPTDWAPIFEGARGIAYEGERSAVLRRLTDLAPAEAAPLAAAVEAAATIGSSDEREKALGAIAQRAHDAVAEPAFWSGHVRAARGIAYETSRRRALEASLAQGPETPEHWRDVLEAAGSMGSSAEQKAVLLAVLERSGGTVTADVARSARRIPYETDRAQVLVAAVAAAEDGPALREAIAAAATLGGSQAREDVLAAVLLHPDLDARTIGDLRAAIARVPFDQSRLRLQDRLIERLSPDAGD